MINAQYGVLIVDKLNEEIFKINENSPHSFSYGCDGIKEVICFDNEVMWNSEEDSDRTIHDNGEYVEPLIDYIKRHFNDYINDISSLKLI